MSAHVWFESPRCVSLALLASLALGAAAGCGDDDQPMASGAGPATEAGAADGPGVDGGVAPVGAPRIAISEIMYNPVLSNADSNDHEFLELHNAGTAGIDLGGWKLSGEIQFTFAAGTVVGPGQFLVVAKKRTALLAVAKYNLAPLAGQVVGDFAGALDDGGGRIVLTDAVGATVDQAAYDDKFPWPLAADSFGAGDGWFSEPEWFGPNDPRALFAPHQNLGHSLERVNFAVPAAEIANWIASPLDGASPGRANSASGAPPVIVEELSAVAAGQAMPGFIRESDKVVIRARLSAGTVTNLAVESYLEFDKGRRVVGPPAPQIVPMVADGATFIATLPAQPARTLVRYRVVGERTAGKREVISPRPSDPIPFGHHAYYVSPAIEGKPYYEILVSPPNWGTLWTNVSPDGPVIGCPADYLDTTCTECNVNPKWNDRVPAVLVFGGEPFDTRARYQGSLEGRLNAEDIQSWPATLPRPTAGPVKAMSWSFSFPRYRRFEGLSRVLLNRLNQSCPGFAHHVAARLDEDPSGGAIPAPRIRRYARVFVNGGPYNYMMDLEPIGADYLERFHGRGKPVGDVYKVFSTGDDLGPWAPGLGQVILPSDHCPMIPVRTRYEYTYKRENHEWRSIDDMVSLITGMSSARDNGPAIWREFMTRNFDVDATMKYYAIQHWGGGWDDNGKNYNVYKLPKELVKANGGPWTITSWDVDRMFGVGFCKSETDCARADMPVRCDPELPRCNRWKRGFLEALLPEYEAKLKQLNETILQPTNVIKIIDEVVAQYDETEARQMLSPPMCDPAMEAEGMRTFARLRYASVKRQLGY